MGEEGGEKRGSKKCGASLSPPVPSASPGSGITCLFPVAENKQNISRKAGEGTRQGVKSTGGHPPPSRRAGTRTTFPPLLPRLLDGVFSFGLLDGFFLSLALAGDLRRSRAARRCARPCWCGGVRTYSHNCGICQIASIFFSPLSRKSAPLQGWKIMPDTTAHATQPRLVRSSGGQKNPQGWVGWG